MSAKPLSILLFADLRRNNASTMRDHIDALGQYSKHEVYPYDPLFRHGSESLDLNEFDVVVIHYSVCVLHNTYLHYKYKEQLAKFKGLKVQFIQDDYRNVNAYMKVMREIGLNVLYTLCPADRIPKLWPEEQLPGVKKYTTLPGYTPDYLIDLETPSLEDRPLDVGYRSRNVPFWLGRLGQEKTNIVKRFLAEAPKYDLKHDVSSREEDRLYGPLWTSFIKSCKTMLGSESGASIVDFDSSIENQVRAYQRAHPRASFDEVHTAILKPHEGNILVNCVSPRAFETTALGTAMVLFPGEYSGVLRPWDHYIPLEKDFSNLSAVVEKVRDVKFLRELTQRAYQDLIASGAYSYRTFVREFDAVVDANASHIAKRSKSGYLRAVQEDIPLGLIMGSVKRVKGAIKGTLSLVGVQINRPGWG
jgi:hypothetical protein